MHTLQAAKWRALNTAWRYYCSWTSNLQLHLLTCWASLYLTGQLGSRGKGMCRILRLRIKKHWVKAAASPASAFQLALSTNELCSGVSQMVGKLQKSHSLHVPIGQLTQKSVEMKLINECNKKKCLMHICELRSVAILTWKTLRPPQRLHSPLNLWY